MCKIWYGCFRMKFKFKVILSIFVYWYEVKYILDDRSLIEYKFNNFSGIIIGEIWISFMSSDKYKYLYKVYIIMVILENIFILHLLSIFSNLYMSIYFKLWLSEQNDNFYNIFELFLFKHICCFYYTCNHFIRTFLIFHHTLITNILIDSCQYLQYFITILNKKF